MWGPWSSNGPLYSDQAVAGKCSESTGERRRKAVAITVVKRDGTREPYDANKINLAIEKAAEGLDENITWVTQIASELELTLFDGITTQQLDEAVIQVALQNVKDDPAFDTVAARLLLKTIYKRVLGDYATDAELKQKHIDGFRGYVERGVEEQLLDPRFPQLFDLDRLAAALEPSNDQLLRYIGLVTLNNRYGIKARNGEPLEVPQYFWMRIAMGLSLNETDPTGIALEFYETMSRLDYLAAGSTLVNAGTKFPQLSNCFVMEMHDDIEHIAKSVRDVMWITKGTGGIGLSVTKLRSQGSPIRSNNTVSTGPIPFMHTIDSVLRAVSRGGKKFGALAFYMENWHLDFPDFLDLRQNSGDPYRRTRTANTAVWISDEFMKRVQNDEPWYLFDPLEVGDLNELYGKAFSERYAFYAAEAEAGRLRMFKKLPARQQFKDILMSLQTTAHPWLTWKDTINNRALNNNTGTIHLSNLCTEICLPQDIDNIAVCNLASINLPRHLQADGTFDWASIERSVRLAVRQLDNLIDITMSSVPEADNANLNNRAIGLGMMGYTDVVEKLGLAYDSEQAYDLIDEVAERISYYAIEESVDLAAERGAYPNFAGSRWSQGLVPFDTLELTEKDRGVPIEVSRRTTLDWDSLRQRVKGGVRNATLMAVAPTASIGLVAGTTPGFDPQFSQIFSRATSNGKFLEVNRNLVAALQERGLWEQVREQVLRSQGDIQGIAAIPDEIKRVYKTSFQLEPVAFLEVAARAQKWIDQAISRNMYLETRDLTDMVDIYSEAWKRGVKTTYYLHMKPRHQAEQSTVRVNKSEEIGGARKGFGASSAPASASAPAAEPATAGAPARRGFGFGGLTSNDSEGK
ncbi:ribonucleoside-diphosphate reductase subunit alpha [Gryllotalpicola protaetiae]|uniref:Ribonucleoside-diphosphate reductase n=1 Tax=Gryllotalpicola protaetiae TaxID=2419771 RepID=A0A387BFC7_9MICO|nr:ribonucleoside-diphosphate reductase subunit alpha [Gryllotalpicola protaetiae]